ncbi:MAG: tape measure protein, partial [Ruminococcus sp.]|nr:tape measure protein [Ruminococcus sp.]
MSQVIDESIVRMRFDGEQFLSGIKSAMNGIASLGSSIKSGIASVANLKNELNFSRINSSFSLDGIEKSLESLSERFSSVGVIGMTALQNLTNSAVDAGKKIAEALVITPVKSGFEEYETQINSVQTILANTESKGTTIEDVNKALDELNKYADMTIYNFTQMTRNIGTFTAAGIDLDTSVSAIKGIANLAAVSGSTSQQASTAMYQLSQALAAGSLKLQDWNSVVNAGMGGQVFQDALKETARVHGIAIDDMIKKEGSFRQTLSSGWITSDILTETLAKFTGDLTAEDLKKIGYSDTQIESVLKMGQTANDAATKVKTFTQLIDTLKESLQSGWTQSWEILIGDFEEAKELLTEVSDTLSALINKSSDSRNALLQSWKDLGGRNSLIDAARNSMNAVITVCGNIKKAFTDVFPPLTAQQLFEFTEKLKELSERFKKVSEVKFTFLTEFLSTVKSALPLAGEMISKVLNATAGIGSLAEAVKGLVKGAGAKAKELLPKVTGFVSELADKIKKALPAAASILQNALSGAVKFFKEFIDLGGIDSLLETVGNVFRFIASAALAAVQAFSEVFSSFGINAETVYGLAEKLRELTASFLSSESAGERLKGIFTSVFGFIRTIAENVGKVAAILLNAARSVIPVLISAFTSGVRILGSFIGLAGQVLPILISVFGTAVTVISSFAGQGLSLAGQILPAIIGAIGKAVRAVSEFIRKFIALGGLSSAAGALRNAFESVRKILGIAGKSFSQVFGTAGSGVSIFVG